VGVNTSDCLIHPAMFPDVSLFYQSEQGCEGKGALERKTASGEDAELDKIGEQQLKRQEELTIGTMVRRKDLAKGKAELKGNLKMRPNWSGRCSVL
jgi:hypothetical protein